MTTDEVMKEVMEEVQRALDDGQTFVNLREVGEDPRQDAKFLMRLYEAFPDETPESGYTTVVILGRRWRASITGGFIRLDPATTPQTTKKRTAKEYQQWWAAELARRGITMRVPEGQHRPSSRYAPTPSEEPDQDQED